MAVVNGRVEVFDEAHLPCGLRLRAVAGDCHEVVGHGQRNRPHQVCQEHQRAFQHAHQQGRVCAVVARNLLPQLAYPRLEQRAVDEDLQLGEAFQPRGVGCMHASPPQRMVKDT
jgi:hypothetical protein